MELRAAVNPAEMTGKTGISPMCQPRPRTGLNFCRPGPTAGRAPVTAVPRGATVRATSPARSVSEQGVEAIGVQ